MNETTIRKRLFRLTVGACSAVAVILTAAVLLLANLDTSLDEAARLQLQREAEEYSVRIARQVRQDTQILNTLAAFLGEQIAVREIDFAQAIHEANTQNHFAAMAYFSLDGSGILSLQVQQEDSTGPVRLEDMGAVTRELVEQAFLGQGESSRIYESTQLESKVLVYSVPVFADGQVVGALVACEDVGVLGQILDEETVLNGGGYLHLLDAEGRFLIRSADAVVDQDLPSVFDGPYIQPEDAQAIRSAMAAQKPAASAFFYAGEEYVTYLEPVGLNGWFVYCVDAKRQSTADTIRLAVNITLIVTILALLVVTGFLFWGYRLLRKNNRELLKLAYVDSTTGAENYAAFAQRLRDLAPRLPSYYLAAINIHQFKFVNELFGQDQGDNLLRAVKQILDASLQKEEFFCRERGDLFYLVMNETDRKQVASRLEGIMNRISRTSLENGHSYQILLYSGAVPAGDDNAMTHVLFALDEARKGQRNAVWFYDEELHVTEALENYIETHMHQALQREAFQMFLQPKMNLATGTIGGAEALVRWETEDGRLLSPGQFIPLFERNGFCTQLDLYMVEHVCRQLRQWLDEGIDPIPISVNQTKLLFYEADYIEKLCALVEKYQVPAQLITLEILEDLAASHIEELNRKILLLQEKGFQISMDDFGSGYSSLNTLGCLQINELKLDRGFLMQVSQRSDPRFSRILEFTVKLAESLRMTTVAEGVETEEDHQLITALGCAYGQGYYYGRPVSAEAFNAAYMGKGQRR